MCVLLYYFAQVKGTAMGIKMAPAYAGLFMAQMEEDFLAAHTSTDRPGFIGSNGTDLLRSTVWIYFLQINVIR